MEGLGEERPMIGGGQFVAAAVLKGTILPEKLQGKRNEHGRR